ncbi:MAG: DUF2460 domain-containing protein [Betaproteobacteria bacterium]|nr:DUF2460 domain-containing protein [Betaproteobacteria bacterium]
MTITVFPDVILGERVIAAGVAGKNIRRNERNTQINGAEYVNVVWTQTLREFEIGFKPMLREAWQDIETLHEITDGGASGFLMQDPKDFEVVTGAGVVTSLGGDQYQLEKLYTHAASGRTKRRNITRPRTAGLVIKVSGTPIDPTDSPAGYSIDVETGILTISSAPSAASVTWTGLFYVPVHFMVDFIDWTMLRPASDEDRRLLAGPSVVLQEVRE